MIPKLGRKQTENNENWRTVWANIADIVSEAEAHALVARTAEAIKGTIRGMVVGYGWSGGKDSQALRVVMERLGIARCVMGVAAALEYPAFLRWAQTEAPEGLMIIDTGQDLPWLAEHQDWLFPADAKTASRWYRGIQHAAQAAYVRQQGLDMLILGRRRADGNFTGGKAGIYTNRQGVTRYAPLRDWTHEQVLGVCYWFNRPLAPCYGWPNGFVVGTGCWPARPRAGSVFETWRELWQIDRSIVATAAVYLPSAWAFLDGA